MKESKIRIEKSKDDYNILKVNIDEKWIYIGSKYNMKNEIDKFLKQAKKTKIFIVFGFSAGEHVKALRDKFKDAQIKVFDPNEEIENYALSLKWVEDDENLNIIRFDKDKMSGKLEFINEFNIQEVQVISFSNYTKIYDKEFLDLAESIKMKLYGCITERNTKFNFSETWFVTAINNIPYMAKSVLIDEYENAYKDKPAIIVSAGPSLDKNIDLLKGIEDDFFIITGGRPLRGLVEKQINPSLLVALDPQDINYRLVKGSIEDTDIPLLFFDSTNEKIVKNHNGYKIFSFSSEEMYNFFDREPKVLSTYGSVAHSMVSAAILLGCNPIIFIGQDFAYTNDSAHSSYLESKHKGSKFEDVKNSTDLWVESVNDGKVRTSIVLNLYRKGMEKIISQHPEIKFINATEGGARMKGTEEMTLSDVIKKYNGCTIEELKNKSVDSRISNKIAEKTHEMYENLKKIRKETKKAIKYTEDLEKNINLNRMNKVSELLRKLGDIDEYIKEKINSFLIIQSLLYPIVYAILTKRDTQEEVNKKEKIKNIINQNNILYNTITQVIEKTLHDFEEVDEELKNNRESEERC